MDKWILDIGLSQYNAGFVSQTYVWGVDNRSTQIKRNENEEKNCDEWFWPAWRNDRLQQLSQELVWPPTPAKALQEVLLLIRGTAVSKQRCLFRNAWICPYRCAKEVFISHTLAHTLTRLPEGWHFFFSFQAANIFCWCSVSIKLVVWFNVKNRKSLGFPRNFMLLRF